jgi:hypothetical protein
MPWHTLENMLKILPVLILGANARLRGEVPESAGAVGVRPACRRSRASRGGVSLWGGLCASGAKSSVCESCVNSTVKPLYKIVKRFYSKSCGLMSLFPPIAEPENLRESRSLTGTYTRGLSCHIIVSKADVSRHSIIAKTDDVGRGS